MKKSFIKTVNFALAATLLCNLGCMQAFAERKFPTKEVKPAAKTLPAITVPASEVKEKIEEKVIIPAADKTGETIKQGRETNAPISDIKNKEEILIKQNADGVVETEVKPVTAPVVNPLAVPVTVPIKASDLNPESSDTPASSIVKPANSDLSLPKKEEAAPVKENSVQKQEGTIFDHYSVKENLKINKPSK